MCNEPCEAQFIIAITKTAKASILEIAHSLNSSLRNINRTLIDSPFNRPAKN
jgi:hypothetical protein